MKKKESRHIPGNIYSYIRDVVSIRAARHVIVSSLIKFIAQYSLATSTFLSHQRKEHIKIN